MLTIGDTLYLDLRFPDEVSKFKCKVEFVGHEELYVTYPTNIHTNKTEFFMVGTRFEAHYITKEKGTYGFKTELIDRRKDKIPLLVLRFPQGQQPEKIQRREFVRIDTSVDLSIHSEDREFPPFNTFTSDISAGGCAVALPEQHGLKSGMKLKAWIVLPLKNENEYIQQKAKVIRVLDGKRGERDKAMLQFLDVKEQDRRIILRFCFEEQLLLKKKGLL